VVASSQTKILVDAGISCSETFKRLKLLGEDPHSLSAILITHEHSDHIYGLATLTKKLRIPVFMTGATHQAWARAMRNEKGERPHLEKFERFESGHGFLVGDIAVKPFTIPHDAADPVGFTFRAEGIKVGVATDLGYVPASVRDHLRGCDVLVMESNHDLEMLRVGPYPWSVKQRVMSRVGHLSNLALADFFTSDYDNSATFVVLAHLSEQNNHPEIARREAEKALASRGGLFCNRLLLASQTEALQPIRL
jgi:phosphoribosyl 1,2-cyclic phosphodiesterase